MRCKFITLTGESKGETNLFNLDHFLIYNIISEKLENSKTIMLRIGNYDFQGPWLLSEVNLIDRAAVYAILCSRNDGKYDLVYVGETGQAGARLSNHERANCWSRNCGNSLFVAILWTPSDKITPQTRRTIEKEIRDQYDPPCNRQ